MPTRPSNRTPTNQAHVVLPALLKRVDAARYCGRSTATWDRLVSAGRTPAPIKMGGAVLFKRTHLDLWIELGCPDRQTFEASLNTSRGN